MKKPSYEVTLNDKLYSFKLTTTAIIGIESKINAPFPTVAVQDTSVTMVTVVIEGALKQSRPETTMKDAVDFIEEYLEEHDSNELMELYTSILETSGFFYRKTSTETESQK